ncbi:MAG: hypothetical protein ACUVXA_06155 [Candidatus Jordarchaeum sp.]|uniref:hypothetical protein n=1 Tax=Candidatus Jordarchaeum sp. TaxID=2823881 RepID=UPI00404AE68E
MEIGDEATKATEKLQRATLEFFELLKKYKTALDETVSLISEYKTEVFPILEKVVNSVSVSEQLEAFKNSGRISRVSETENVGIPLAICSTSYGEGDNKLFGIIEKIYEEFEDKNKPFNYFFFPDYEGKVEISESFTKIVKMLFVEKINKSANKVAIVINLRTLPQLPSGGGKIFVDKKFRRDSHNIREKLKELLDKNISVEDDEELFGGGSLTYCLKLMAESEKIVVSVLDLTITKDIVEINKIRELVQILCEIVEKEIS